MQRNLDEENTKAFLILNEIILTLKDVRAISGILFYIPCDQITGFEVCSNHSFIKYRKYSILKYNFVFGGVIMLLPFAVLLPSSCAVLPFSVLEKLQVRNGWVFGNFRSALLKHEW